MYDQSLEQLIDAVIADGVITDQERRVVFKKAASLGIDQDEIEVYLEGRLDAAKKKDGPKPGKQGIIKTCPNCGATVEAGLAKCAECGYAFSGLEANSSAKELDRRLREIGSDNLGLFGASLGLGTAKKRADIIQSFPVPNTKEDLLEFIYSIEPKIEDGAVGEEEEAYEAKYKECILKLRHSFPNSPDVKPILDKYDEREKDKEKSSWGLGKFIFSFICFFALIGGAIWIVNYFENKQVNELISQIDQLPTPNENNYLECFREYQKIQWTGDMKNKKDSLQYVSFREAKAGYADLLRMAFKAAGVSEEDLPRELKPEVKTPEVIESTKEECSTHSAPVVEESDESGKIEETDSEIVIEPVSVTMVEVAD